MFIDSVILSKPQGAKDEMFIISLDTSGHVIFATALTSGGDDQNGVAVGPSGCVYITGDFETDSTNILIIGNDTLHHSGGLNSEDIFTAKLCDNGIPENISVNNKNQFLLYPNPCHDVFNIKGIVEAEISLYDVTSRLLLHQTVTHSASINTENLANGIYFIEVKNANGASWNGKIIKE